MPSLRYARLSGNAAPGHSGVTTDGASGKYGRVSAAHPVAPQSFAALLRSLQIELNSRSLALLGAPPVSSAGSDE